jgi:hypothetical protein
LPETPEPDKPVETINTTRVPQTTVVPRPRPTPTPNPTTVTPQATATTPEPTAEVPEATVEPEPTPAPTPAPVSAFVTGSASVKLAANNSAQGKKFGTYVAIEAGTVIAGAPTDFSKGTNSGAAVVFTKADGIWTEQAKLVGDDTGAEDLLGQAVALSGETAVLGAPGDTPIGTGSGSAYVFVRSEGVWTQQAKLTASDAAMGDQFGQSAAISGDTIIISAPMDDSLGGNSGSAYVFTRNGGTWTGQAKLTGSGLAMNGMFGWSVTIDGDTAAIGALGDTINGSNSGAAYVFTRTDGVWTEQVNLTASDGTADHNFGRSVALSGATLAVGAPGNADKGANTGAAYVFTSSDGVWTEQAKITASDASTADNFGWSVSISGETLAAGAFGDAAKGLDAGSVYVYNENRTPGIPPKCAADGGKFRRVCASMTIKQTSGSSPRRWS